MDYHTRFGLEFNPFLKNDKKDILVETKEYQECKTRLDYLVNSRGFGLITGESGRGKTSTIRHWSKTLSPSLYNVIYISLSTITVDQFYYQLAEYLGLDPQPRKTKNYKNIQNLIRNIAIERRKIPVIILDEANYMNSSILNDLKMLFNFEMDSKDYAVILLVGLPTLINTLNTKTNEPLRQRIIMNYHVEGINKNDVKKYVDEKLESAGVLAETFTPNAIEAISNGSDGSLRVINKICNNALMIGDVLETNIINEDIIMRAINEMSL